MAPILSGLFFSRISQALLISTALEPPSMIPGTLITTTEPENRFRSPTTSLTAMSFPLLAFDTAFPFIPFPPLSATSIPSFIPRKTSSPARRSQPATAHLIVITFTSTESIRSRTERGVSPLEIPLARNSLKVWTITGCFKPASAMVFSSARMLQGRYHVWI